MSEEKRTETTVTEKTTQVEPEPKVETTKDTTTVEHTEEKS